MLVYLTSFLYQLILDSKWLYKKLFAYTITVKDARSVSLYPYNWSQILQYVKYTK